MSASRKSSNEETGSAPSIEFTEIHAPVDLVRVQELVDQFMRVRSPAEGRRMLEQHSELLSDEYLFILDRIVDAAREAGDAEAVFVLHERRGLLQRCREVGVAAAFEELGR
jgi:hypothetical protein